MATFASHKRFTPRINTYSSFIMKNIKAISSILVLGTSFSALVSKWLSPSITLDLTDEDTALYL